MLLAIDIGNTKIALGVFVGEELRSTWRISTDRDKTAEEYAVLLFNLMSQEGLTKADIDGAVLCSVVPPLTPTIEQLCRRHFGVSPLLIEAGVKTGVRICTDNPREVGADRVVNAAAAHRLYTGPVIVIDFGTATTFDAVSKEGDYLGGAIAPGIGIAAEALYERTAQLPRVELIRPKQAIGKSTVTAMQSGIVFGYVGLIEGVVAHIRRELGKGVKVVATGTLAEIIAKETPVVEAVNPHLTLIGLRVIYEMNKT